MEVMNFLETKTYELTDEGKVLVIKNWLGTQGLKLIKYFTNEEKDTCRTEDYKGTIFCIKPKVKAMP